MKKKSKKAKPGDGPFGLPVDGKAYLGDCQAVHVLVEGIQKTIVVGMQLAAEENVPADQFWKHAEETITLYSEIFRGENPNYAVLAGNWNGDGLASWILQETGWSYDLNGAVQMLIRYVVAETVKVFDGKERLASLARWAVHMLLGVPMEVPLPTDGLPCGVYAKEEPSVAQEPSSDESHGFAKIHWSDRTLDRYGLPHIDYPVQKSAYPKLLAEPTFDLVQTLRWLQLYVAETPKEAADYGSAMIRLSDLLADRDCNGREILIRGQGWPLVVGNVDLTQQIITVQRRMSLVAALALTQDGIMRVACFQPLDNRALGLIVDLALYSVRDDSVRGDNASVQLSIWKYAENKAIKVGQAYAAERGESYLSYWEFGLGLDMAKKPVAEWFEQRTLTPMVPAVVAAQFQVYGGSSEHGPVSVSPLDGNGNEGFDAFKEGYDAFSRLRAASREIVVDVDTLDDALCRQLPGKLLEVANKESHASCLDGKAVANIGRSLAGLLLKACQKPSVIAISPLSVSQQAPSDTTLRRAGRIIAMVHELHKAGYQLLRIAPGQYGRHWQCFILPARAVSRNGWEPLVRQEPGGMQGKAIRGEMVACYTTAQENHYFGWVDAAADDARRLAAKFLERFPRIATVAKGLDWRYAGWLTWILGGVENGHLPVLYGDYPVECDSMMLPPSP